MNIAMVMLLTGSVSESSVPSEPKSEEVKEITIVGRAKMITVTGDTWKVRCKSNRGTCAVISDNDIIVYGVHYEYNDFNLTPCPGEDDCQELSWN